MTRAKADEWARWWKGLSGTTQEMDDTFADAYHAALERIALTQTPVRRSPV